MNSLRYTSTCARAVARVCGDRASQYLSATSVAATSFDVVSGVFFSARFSRWWGGAVWRVDRVSSAQSLTVSVVAQKKAADSTYPLGIDRLNPTIYSSSGVALGTRNDTEGMSSSLTQMRI